MTLKGNSTLEWIGLEKVPLAFADLEKQLNKKFDDFSYIF